MIESTDVEEFDKFIDQLPEEVVQSLRFVPVKKNKAADVPEEQDLTKDKFWLNLEEARGRIQSGENVGPVLSDRLSVLILMDSEEAQAFLEDLPSTLEVSTRSGETHFYYLRGDGVESKDIPGVAELRTGNRYVVAPGCYASNGSGDTWGAYTVEEAREVVEITPDELPTELKPKEKLGKRENINEHGWRIEKIREEDEVLDGLLTREKPPNLGFMSKEDADRKTIEKLLYWEFSPGTITDIMKEYRGCGEEVNPLYAEVITEFKEREGDVISDVENIDTFKPGSKEMRSLTRGTKKKLEEKVFDDDRASWSCDTKFVTFSEGVPLPSGKKVENRRTFELPFDLADELIDKDKTVEHGWKCLKCGEVYEQEEKPLICENPNCGKKGPFKSLHPTEHDEIGDVLMDNYIFRTMRQSGQIYFHNGGKVFEGETSESKIREKTKEIAPDCKKHLQDEALEHIKTNTYMDKDKFGLPKEKIAVKNGILNLGEEELEEFDPDKHTPLAKLPVKYDPDADCPEIKKLVSEVFKEGDIDLVQEYVGFCLWKDYKFAKALVLLGSGENGKSTFLNLLSAFLGEENVSGTSLYNLLKKETKRINLHGKLANLSAETPENLKNTDSFKKMTGKDLIEGRRLYKDGFKFRNYAKLIFAANKLPELDEHTHAMFRRILLVDCPYRFTTDPNDGHKDAELGILERVVTEKELSGFLNWALEGLNRLMKNQGFTKSHTSKEVEERWIRETDPERAFITNFIQTDYSTFVTKADLHEAYKDYCAENDLEATSQTVLTKTINAAIPGAKQWKPAVGEEQVKSFRNIRLGEPYQEYNRNLKGEKQGGVDDYITDSMGNSTNFDCGKSGEDDSSSTEIGFSSKHHSNHDISYKEEVLHFLSDNLARSKGEISDELGIPIERVSDCLKDLYDEGLVEKGGKKLDGGMLYRVVGSDE